MRTYAIFLIALLLLGGCAPAPESARGFRLPDGDPTKGEEVFRETGCEACHTLAGEGEGSSLPARVVLGGEVTRVRTYGDLVTSIINPSHRIAANVPESMQAGKDLSMMEFASVNDKITVTELIDLVAFLQGQYEVVPPDVEPYLYYYK